MNNRTKMFSRRTVVIIFVLRSPFILVLNWIKADHGKCRGRDRRRNFAELVSI